MKWFFFGRLAYEKTTTRSYLWFPVHAHRHHVLAFQGQVIGAKVKDFLHLRYVVHADDGDERAGFLQRREAPLKAQKVFLHLQSLVAVLQGPTVYSHTRGHSLDLSLQAFK